MVNTCEVGHGRIATGAGAVGSTASMTYSVALAAKDSNRGGMAPVLRSTQLEVPDSSHFEDS